MADVNIAVKKRGDDFPHEEINELVACVNSKADKTVVSQALTDITSLEQDVSGIYTELGEKDSEIEGLQAGKVDKSKQAFFNVLDYGAAGDGVADDTTAIQAALSAAEEAGGGTVLLPGPRTYAIANTLIISSNTKIEATGATVLQKTGTNKRMIRTAADVAGSGRTTNIEFRGGEWNKQANGGVNNDQHGIFIRRSDNIKVSGISFKSTGGKYAFAFGDCTNIHVTDMVFDVASDCVHLSGPITHCVIENMIGVSGDDMVGVTTQDYISYDDTRGDVKGLTIRNLNGNNISRVVLLGCTAYSISDVIIDGIIQNGVGYAATIGDGGATGGVVDRVRISNCYGGGTRIAHSNIGTLDLKNIEPGVAKACVEFTKETTGGVCNVRKAIVQNCYTNIAGGAIMALNNNATTIKDIVFERCETGVSGTSFVQASGGAVVDSITIKNCKFAGGNHFFPISGTIGNLRILESAIHIAGANNRVVLLNSGTIKSVLFRDCDITSIDANTGDLVYFNTAGDVNTITVDNCKMTGIRGVVQQRSGAAKTDVYLTNLKADGLNRIAQCGGILVLNYSNIEVLNPVTSAALYVFGGGTARVIGRGWAGSMTGKIQRSSSEVITVNAPDFPCDISLLGKTNGDSAYNTNASLSCGVGMVISNGANWKNNYSGLAY